MGVLSALPIVAGGNVCCCMWIISGGFLAAYLDSQNTSRSLTVGRGALVGFLAGVAGADERQPRQHADEEPAERC